MTKKLKAIIAAGGNGTRLGLNHPKSGLMHFGHSLIYWTALSLHLAGVKEILVFINNKTWGNKFERELEGIPGCIIVIDNGYENTFLLFKDYYSSLDSYIFTYGHTPRPQSYYKKFLFYREPLVVSRVHHSTKRKPIVISSNDYIEPPYFIDPQKNFIETATSWLDFFELNRTSDLKFIKLQVGEFNYPNEWTKYQSYLKTDPFESLFNEANNIPPIFQCIS